VLGNTTTVDVQALLKASLNMSLRSTCFTYKISTLGAGFLNW